MKPLFLFGALTLLSGCVSLLPATAPPSPRYTINPVDMNGASEQLVDWSLVIEDPKTSRVYDSVRMAVSTAPGKIEYFPEAEWADRAPKLFSSALTETFQDSGRILAVGDRSAVPLGDFVLQTDIRKAQLNVQGTTSTVEVVVFARLTNGKGHVFAAQKFSADEPVQRENADIVAARFNAAFMQVISDIASWTFTEGNVANASAA